MKKKETAAVLAQQEISGHIFSLTLSVSFADKVRAGQFVSLFSRDRSRILPRPISVCDADPDRGTIRLVYRTAGAGTREFSSLKKGDSIELIGPLGNGFPAGDAAGKRVLLVGGGIGIPPMIGCAKAIAKFRGQPVFAVGYRSRDTYLLKDMKRLAPVILSTDDGSLGVRGTVVDAIRESHTDADLIFACGPKAMLRSIKDFAAGKHIPCFVSMEERMACGVGVCLGCVCRTTETDAHSLVHNARICKDGPVFEADYVDLT